MLELHFCAVANSSGELIQMADWAEQRSGAASVIIDARGHYFVYMCTTIDDTPVLLLLDSLPVTFPRARRSGQSGVSGGRRVESV